MILDPTWLGQRCAYLLELCVNLVLVGTAGLCETLLDPVSARPEGGDGQAIRPSSHDTELAVLDSGTHLSGGGHDPLFIMERSL